MDNELVRKVVSGIAVTLLMIGGLWVAWNLTTAPGGQESNEPTEIETSINDNWMGNQESDVILVEFSDFQCPACRSFSPIVKQLMEEYGDRIGLVYKHFPLPQHDKSELAAYAAEAAGNQDKFFEMHDLLFENQDAWAAESDPTGLFVDYATELELDIETFQSDMKSSAVKDKVSQDVISGTKAGVNSTPTFFLNGVRIQNPGSYQEFAALIDSALETSSGTTLTPSDSDSTPEADVATSPVITGTVSITPAQ